MVVMNGRDVAHKAVVGEPSCMRVRMLFAKFQIYI